MSVNFDDLSQPVRRTFIQVMCADGNCFEIPATDDVDVSNFMSGVKARGYIGTGNWFVVYEAILWAAKVVYTASGVSSVEGMVKQ